MSNFTPAWFKKGFFNESLFCDDFLSTHQLLYSNGAFFTPDGRMVDPMPLRCEIFEMMREYVGANLAKKVTNVVDVLKLAAQVEDFPPVTDRIALANGTLYLDGTFQEGKPEIVRNRLPVRYDPKAPQPSHWLRFLSDLLYPEDIPTVQEFIGYCLIPSNKGQRMMVIKGSGGEGKSQIGVVLYYAIPLLAGLAVGHAFIPPTPGPVLVAAMLGVDLGWVILIGIFCGIFAMIVAGPIWGGICGKKYMIEVPEHVAQQPDIDESKLPKFGTIVGIILIPLVLIIANSVAKVVPALSGIQPVLGFLGEPFVALTIAVIAAMFLLGYRHGYSNEQLEKIMTKSLEPTGMILLVTACGGVLRYMLQNSGLGGCDRQCCGIRKSASGSGSLYRGGTGPHFGRFFHGRYDDGSRHHFCNARHR